MVRRFWGLVAVLLVLAVGVGMFTYVGMQKARVEPKMQIQIFSADETAARGLVVNFYKAIEDQDGKKLFGYMTMPSSAQEKDSFNWLTGADLKSDSFYRAFLRIKIFNPKIDDVQKIDDNTFVLRVTDQMSTYSNSQDIGWNSPKPRYDILLTLVKVDGSWMVDKFRNSSEKTGTDKYSGFGQGLSM